MMTEDEARKCWCPFARDVTGQGSPETTMAMASFNRPFQDHYVAGHTCACIGSRCMAWRWDSDGTEKTEYFAMGKRPEGDGWVCTLSDEGRETMMIKSRWERPDPDRRGHCGLAGKP